MLNVLNKLVDRGNTVIIIENLDVIKQVDYLIDWVLEEKWRKIVAQGYQKKSLNGKKFNWEVFEKELRLFRLNTIELLKNNSTL